MLFHAISPRHLSISDFFLRKKDDFSHIYWEISVAPDFIEFEQ